MVNLEKEPSPKNPDSHSTTEPAPRNAGATILRWTLVCVFGFILFLAKGIFDVNMGFRFGGGAILNTISITIIILLCCAFYYSPIFKATYNKLKFKKLIIFSLVFIFLYYIDLISLHSPAPDKTHQLLNSKNYTYQDNINQQSNNSPSSKPDKEFGGIEVKIPEKPKYVKEYKSWKFIVFQSSASLSTSALNCTSELAINAFKNGAIAFALFDLSETNYGKSGNGYFNIDGYYIPINYSVDTPRDAMFHFLLISFPEHKLVNVAQRMEKGRTLIITFASTQKKFKFSLNGFTAASTALARWFRDNS